MDVRTTKQVAQMLRMHPSRIEQWIAREQFLPGIFAKKGLGRDWTLDEVIRLMVFVRLVDMVGMEPKVAGVLTQVGFHGFNDARALFVAYHGGPERISGWGRSIVREPDLGEFLAGKCQYPKVLKAGYDAETIAENSRPNLGPAYAAVVLNLDQIASDLTAVWSE